MKNLEFHNKILSWAKCVASNSNIPYHFWYKSVIPYLGYQVRGDVVLKDTTTSNYCLPVNYKTPSAAVRAYNKIRPKWFSALNPSWSINIRYKSGVYLLANNSNITDYTNDLLCSLNIQPNKLLLNGLKRDLSLLTGTLQHFKDNSIKGVLLPWEDAYPMSIFATAGQMLDLPRIVFQHGLDCEPFIYSELSQSTKYYTWGEWSSNRIKANTINIGKWNHPTITAKHCGDAIGLFTRPHTPIRCRYPEYHINTGVNLLTDVCNFAGNRKIIFHPHPADYVEVYNLLCTKEQYKNVELGTDHLSTIEQTQFILCEDSTVAIDLLAAGAHIAFIGDEPILPYKELKLDWMSNINTHIVAKAASISSLYSKSVTTPQNILKDL